MIDMRLFQNVTLKNVLPLPKGPASTSVKSKHLLKLKKDGLAHCSKCDKTKPIAEFSKNKRRLTGIALHCKECISIAERYRRYG